MKKIRSIPFRFSSRRFGSTVQAAMFELGLTNQDVATLADCSPSTIANVIAGEYDNIMLKIVLNVANALDLDLREYFELED